METQTQARLRERLIRSVVEQQALLRELERCARDAADAREAGAVQRRLSRLGAEQARLVAELEIAQLVAPRQEEPAAGRAGRRPMREQVLDVLDEIGVAVAPRVISDAAFALSGWSLPAARFASLRRDEERAYRKDPTARPAWVVPAINVVGLTPIPRIVASSAWEPERRLIGARTLRTNHLKTLLALLRRGDRPWGEDQTSPARLAALIRQYADGVSGALAPGEDIDYGRVQTAAAAELARIEPLDAAERQTAARQLGRLPRADQLWGRAALPLVIEGGAPRSRAG